MNFYHHVNKQRVPMAKPQHLVYGVDFLEPNVLNEAEVAKIRVEFHIPHSVVMRIPGPLEPLSNPNSEVVFVTDVFKHGLRLSRSFPRLATPLGTIRPPLQRDKGEECRPSEGAELSEDLVSASSTGVWILGLGTRDDLSLKWSTASKRDIEAIERVREKVAKEDRFFKSFLEFGNLYKASLITKLEYGNKRGYKEAAGVASPQRKKDGPPRPRTKAPHQVEGPSAEEVTVAESRREKRAAEFEVVKEAYLQVSGKRQIEGALDVTPLLKRPRRASEDVVVLIPDDEEGADAEPVNMNRFINGAQMKLHELEQLPMKTLHFF
ncbi:unnamed protein product [Prunus brigantina]